MMTHRVNHAELEVIVAAREVGEQLLDRLSLLRERRIAPLIDRVCSELSGPERIERIERIELDLGSIAFVDFDDDFIRKLEAALRGALTKAVPAQANAQAQTRAALELVEIFAWTGNLPWWADASSSDPVRAQIDALLVEAPRAMVELLGELAQDRAALARILRHVDSRALAGLLRGEEHEPLAILLGDAFGRPLEVEPNASVESNRERASIAKVRAGEHSETFKALAGEQAERPTLTERLHALLRNLIAAGGAALGAGRSSEDPRSSMQIEPDHDAKLQQHLQRETGGSEEHSAGECSETLEALLRELTEDRELHAWMIRELEHASAKHDARSPRPPSSSDEAQEASRLHVPLRELTEEPRLVELLEALLASRAALATRGSSEQPRAPTQGGRNHEVAHAPVEEQPAASEEGLPADKRRVTFESLLRELIEEPLVTERLYALLQAPRAAGRAALVIGESSDEPSVAPHSSIQESATLEAQSDRRAETGIEPAALEQHPTGEQSQTFESLLDELTADGPLHAWVIRELERVSTQRNRDDQEPSMSSEQERETAGMCALLLNRILAVSEADSISHAEHPAPPRPLEPERRQHTRAEPAAKRHTRARSSSDARAPNQPARARAARHRAVERLEELYVENAGLVLLWPFLPRFFARVGLLDDKQRFLDEPARMQAIALLEGLAREDLDPPEFRLPLAKLFCGLAPIDEFELEQPLAAEQLAECEHLLGAVIDNAPILRAMSVPSFRASFLQRSGVLCTRDGSWLLQVERADYDVVLERFPWSWDWLKLPWMSDAIRVDW